jgi:hypothetical protein
MLAGTVWETNSLLALQLVWFVNATGTQESSCGLPAKKKCATTTRLSVVLDTTLDQEEPLLHAAWMESSKLDLLTSDNFEGTGPFAKMTEKMDTMLYRFNVGSWVNFLSFSHSSQTFAFGSKYINSIFNL